MLQPVRRRTLSPRGKTPIQSAWDRHERRSAIGAVSVSPKRSCLRLYYQLLPENVSADDMELFLEAMHKFFRHQVTLVWDRYSVHRSVARRMQTAHPDWFDFEWLPAYAPELNPTEQCWNHTKYVDLANFIPRHVVHLEKTVTSSMSQQCKDQTLLRSFFAYSKLKL
jgi:transposase